MPDTGIQLAKLWLRALSPAILPLRDFSITFSRSSGPGGQKVNKTSSKATVTLEQWRHKNWIPEEIRHQLVDKGFRYATKSGDIVVHNDTLRSREKNAALCLQKLCQEIKRTVVFDGEVSDEDKLKWVNISKRTNEQRLMVKKARATRKQNKKVDLY